MAFAFLSRRFPLERQYFLIPRLTLKLVGCWPESKMSPLLLALILFNFTLLVVVNCAQIHFGIVSLNIDVLQALEALCPMASSSVSLMKIVLIYWYRDDMRILLGRLKDLLENSGKGEEKIKIRQGYSLLATRLNSLVLLFGFATNTAFSLRPIVVNTLRVINGKDFVFETPLRLQLPAMTLRMELYPFVCSFISYYGYVTVFSFVGVDGIFIGFCLYVTALMQMLQDDVKITFKEIADNDIVSEMDNHHCFEKLVRIVQRHNEISHLTKTFTSLFSLITLGHFVSAGIVIGTSIVAVLFFTEYGSLVYISFTFAVLTELFLYCYGGTSIAQSSMELGNIAYSCDWYKCDERVKKMLLLIIVRAQKPLVIKVPFFAPSLPTFTSIIQFSGSLIALAKSIL